MHFRGNDRPYETRVNEHIQAREVRLIDENGEMLGVMPPVRALEIARARGLDLVEVSPNFVPPVCLLMDYGRYKDEQTQQERHCNDLVSLLSRMGSLLRTHPVRKRDQEILPGETDLSEGKAKHQECHLRRW